MTEQCFYCSNDAEYILGDDSCICKECWEELSEDEQLYHGGIDCNERKSK